MTAVLAGFASVALAALIAVAAYASSTSLLAVAVGVGVLTLALGWGPLLELPARRGTSLVIVAIGWTGAGLAVLAVGMVRPLAPFAALLALAVLVAFAHELMRRHGREDLVESLTGTLSGEAIALLGGGWVLLPSTPLSTMGVLAVASAMAGARVVSALPLPERALGWVALAAGGITGTAVALVLEPTRLLPTAATAVVVSGVVAGLDRLFAGLPSARSVPAALACAAAPVLAVGTVAYAVARFMS